jgi:PAS domain S-box-containing protein
MADAGSPLDHAMAAGTSGSWEWDIGTDKLWLDERFAELYGLDKQQARVALPTSIFFSRIHPKDKTRMRIAVAGMLGGSEIFSKEFRIQAPDGSERWMHGRGQTILGANDEPLRFTGLLVDVTDRKRAEERLRIAQKAGGIGTFEYIDGFATVTVSEEFCSLLGLLPAPALPVPTINRLASHEHGQLIPPRIEENATELNGEFLITRRDNGQPRWIARRGEIIREGTFGGYRLVGVIYDISAIKSAEHKLQELNDTLEVRVRTEIDERLGAQEALRQAQKMEAVGQLTGGIAHDFNNLLTVISGSVDTVSRRLDHHSDPRIIRAIENAKKGVERAAALTQRLLAFSRRQPLSPKRTDVAKLLAGMSDLLTRSIAEMIAIQIQSDEDLWPVHIDPHQLENVILNLAVNARDAMPNGGNLTIAARNELAGGEDRVLIEVADTGSGMDAATLSHVFDPFFTTKEIGKGTGLGLSMVYGFVNQSGGSIDIKSDLGAGTTVRIRLPRMKAPASEEQPVRQSTQFRSRNKLETLLVVEDDDDVRAYCVELLRELGYRVIEAHDGASALRLLQRPRQRVHLLLTDVIMPSMSGRELAQAARLVNPKLLVLFMSGYPKDVVSDGGALEVGIDLVPKPFSYAQLSTKVREVLDRSEDD